MIQLVFFLDEFSERGEHQYFLPSLSRPLPVSLCFSFSLSVPPPNSPNPCQVQRSCCIADR